MWPIEVTHEPCSVTCLWIISADTSKPTSPPSPTNAQRPQVAVLASARCRAAGLPRAVDRGREAAAAGQLRDPARRALVGRHRACRPARGRAASRRRSGETSVPTTGPAPIARASIAAARPTGPRPVTSRLSRPETSEPQQRLVGRAEAAGDERAVDVRQRVGQQQAGVLLGQQVLRVAAVALPAVRRPGRVGAADQVPAAALARRPRSRRCGRPPPGRPRPAACSPGRPRPPGRTARGRRPPPGRPPARGRGARGRSRGCRCRRSTTPSSPAAPGRGPAPGSGGAPRSTVLSPGSRTPSIWLTPTAPRSPAWRGRRARAASRARRRTPW